MVFDTTGIIIRVIKSCISPAPKVALDSYCHEIYIKRIKKGLLNCQLKVNEQLLYFPFPLLKELISQKIIDFQFLCYNIPFVFKLYLKPGAVSFPDALLSEETIVKAIIYLTKKDITKDNYAYIKNYIIINAINGEVVDFNIAGITLESLSKTENDKRNVSSKYK